MKRVLLSFARLGTHFTFRAMQPTLFLIVCFWAFLIGLPLLSSFRCPSLFMVLLSWFSSLCLWRWVHRYLASGVSSCTRMACLCSSASLSDNKSTVFVLLQPFSSDIRFGRIPCWDVILKNNYKDNYHLPLLLTGSADLPSESYLLLDCPLSSSSLSGMMHFILSSSSNLSTYYLKVV